MLSERLFRPPKTPVLFVNSVQNDSSGPSKTVIELLSGRYRVIGLTNKPAQKVAHKTPRKSAQNGQNSQNCYRPGAICYRQRPLRTREGTLPGDRTRGDTPGMLDSPHKTPPEAGFSLFDSFSPLYMRDEFQINTLQVQISPQPPHMTQGAGPVSFAPIT